MTLVGPARFLSVITVVASTPQAGQRACLGVCKDRWAVNDASFGGVILRDLDHINAKQRSAVVARRFIEATGKFFLIADAGDTRVVNNDVAIGVWSRHNRVRV